MSKIERAKFPATFKSLKCESAGLTTVRGIKWPRSLSEMRIGGNPIVSFEIRKSDLPLFKALILSPFFTGDIIQPKCADTTAQIVVVDGKQLCVISDDRFEAVYVNGNGVTPDGPANSGTSAGPIAASSSGSGTTSGSQPTDSNGSTSPGQGSSTDSRKASTAGRQGSTTSDEVDSISGSLKNGESNSSSDGRPPVSRSPVTGSTKTVTNSTSSNTALVIGVCCGGAALLMAVIGLCGYAAKRRQQSANGEGEDKYSSLATPQASSWIQTPPISDDMYLSNDVRNDQALIPYRIEQRNLPKGEQIAMSKASAMYKSTFQGQDVVVKQLPAGSSQDQQKLTQFMDEIRTCASLQHHKIVAFIGIAWSSVRDLSVVMEFMPLGDLGTFLLSLQDSPRAQDWTTSWSSAHIKSKAAIAQDVVEAVVYLHSFNKPILHRNLKARNVLLDNKGNAKLSGFGISRESSEDATMTGEIGTAAWMAPEILRGERYDEKVDVYSLGVLLVEMDRCQHPYANDPTLQASPEHKAAPSHGRREAPAIAPNNTQIAVLVSSGKLRPSVSSECPEPIASLVAKCVSFDPAERPMSMAVFYGLRQARKAVEQS